MRLLKSHRYAALQQCNITYRPSLKVIVQRFVQQRSLAALLRAHQCNVDIVVCPCKPLVPCGNSHCVIWHGRQRWLQKCPNNFWRWTKKICRKASLHTRETLSLKDVAKISPFYSALSFYYWCTLLTSAHFSCTNATNTKKMCNHTVEGGAGHRQAIVPSVLGVISTPTH